MPAGDEKLDRQGFRKSRSDSVTSLLNSNGHHPGSRKRPAPNGGELYIPFSHTSEQEPYCDGSIILKGSPRGDCQRREPGCSRQISSHSQADE